MYNSTRWVVLFSRGFVARGLFHWYCMSVIRARINSYTHCILSDIIANAHCWKWGIGWMVTPHSLTVDVIPVPCSEIDTGTVNLGKWKTAPGHITTMINELVAPTKCPSSIYRAPRHGFYFETMIGVSTVHKMHWTNTACNIYTAKPAIQLMNHLLCHDINSAIQNIFIVI